MCEHQIPLRQLRIDTSRSFIREGWQCDIPRVSDPTAWSVTQTSMYADRGPSSSSPRESRRMKGNRVAVTLPWENATRERMQKRESDDAQEDGEWNADPRMHPVTLLGWRFFWKISIRRGNAAKIILGRDENGLNIVCRSNPFGRKIWQFYKSERIIESCAKIERGSTIKNI